MSAASSYVRTKDARQAVKGREAEIVRAIGIPWREGQRNHITCPYPEHGGANDWRLMPKGVAICTCTGGKTDSVFDVVSKVEGLDFEASKIRCVEIIGRKDLIRQKGGELTFQAIDARSLLNAPADRRDDSLPRAYLAHRLGIEPEAVPMPRTPAVGLVALPYYDPSKSSRERLPKVGEFPCAVFGTTDAQGRQHAHRIYLAPGGAGKAEVGRGSDGKLRNPKLSAKREGEENTAGQVVIWGNPAAADCCVLTEGIENAAAVAYALKPELERNEIAVVSAINAGGVEAFRPWPATKRITIAADRDEALKPGRLTPTRRGERAARLFGIRNAAQVSVEIALPGRPGTETDWLDVHASEGPDAVRAGILSAVPLVATAEEAKAERERVEELRELERIERDYPVPKTDALKLGYRRTSSGRIRVHRWAKVGQSMEEQPIASPFGVLARLRYADQQDAYGLRVVVEDMAGKRRAVDVERAAFAKQAASDTRAMLFSAGLCTEGDGEQVVVACLKAAEPATEIVVVRAPGWHSFGAPDQRCFVGPSGKIIGVSGDQSLELSVSSRISEAVAVGGTLEGWKRAIATAVETPQREHWAIGAMAGFGAPLVSLLGLETCGINLSGRTSGGKTIAQRLAVSAWCRAALDQRDSLLQTARATANGIEAMAARACGTILALDELGHISGKELGGIIYGVASGTGKSRMTIDGALRSSHVWSTFVVLSAEKSLEEKVRGDGGEWYGGMAARIPDVDVSGANRAVACDAMARIQAIDQHFGHAGPFFVAELIEQGLHRQTQQLRETVNQTAAALAGPGADSALIRAAMPFAILRLAGTLAKRFGLLPSSMDVDGSVQWAWLKFQNSTDAMVFDPESRAVANLRTWIVERWGSSIRPTECKEETRQSVRDALGWYDDDAVYIPRGRLVEAAGGTLKEIEISRILDRLGFIVKSKAADCYFANYVPKLGRIPCYALSRSEFGRPKPTFTIHAGGRA